MVVGLFGVGGREGAGVPSWRCAVVEAGRWHISQIFEARESVTTWSQVSTCLLDCSEVAWLEKYSQARPVFVLKSLSVTNGIRVT